jgi:hypothetical protein
MKLPDFTNDQALNSLRDAMSAKLRDYKPPPPGPILTKWEIEQLQTEGIEIPIEEVRVLNDGTHVYKDRRVIVYIRDVAEYNNQYDLPRFHLAMCSTLARMMEEGLYKKRYVVATREDGKFNVHKIRDRNINKSDEQLNICKNCLEELHYKGYSYRMETQKRSTMVRDFSLKSFFEEFGRTCVWAIPKYDAKHAPINVYSPHFYRIARAIKEQRGYRCEKPSCGIDLSKPEDRRFLHAHHIDRDKSDNDPTNIRLLCIRCHADTFQHSHIRDNPDYAKFCAKFRLILA